MRVIYGDHNTFRALTHGVPSQSTLDYFAQEAAIFDSRVDSIVLEHVAETEDFFATMQIEEAIASLRAAGNAVASDFLPNQIFELMSIDEIQNAPDIMVPWIMANPVLDEMRRDNRIEGYGDRFTEFCSEFLGDSHPLYQHVVDGLWIEQADGTHECTMYAAARADEELQLDMKQQLAILNTWGRAVELLEGERDPTSPFNAML